jgi:CubicO group peptidase (beta-lactamase class C family)
MISVRRCAGIAVVALAAATAQSDDSQNAQSTWPDTYAGRWAKAYFPAFNAEGKEALRTFIAEHYSDSIEDVEAELAGHLLIRSVTGTVSVHSGEADGEYSIDAIVDSANLGWVRFRFTFSPDPPHDPTGIGPVAAAQPPALVEQEPDDYRDWKDLSDLTSRVCRDAGAPAMAAAIVRGDTIVEESVVGVRRIDHPELARLDDCFHIGSVTKVFTATLAGILLEAGVLRWDMTVGEVLPDIPMNEAFRKVSLEQLLHHRGGIPNLPTTGEFSEGFPQESGRTPAECRAALVHQVLTEEALPIGEPSYSNAGYVVAGTMIERVTGESWEELLRAHLFEPLELRTAGFGWPTEQRPDQPMGHLGSPPDLRVQEKGEYPLGDMDYMGPAGNLHCSIRDLARFATFHLHGLQGRSEVLTAETFQHLWDKSSGSCCYLGSGGSFFAMLAVYPERNVAVVAATNVGLPAWPHFERMRDAIFERPEEGEEAGSESQNQ